MSGVYGGNAGTKATQSKPRIGFFEDLTTFPVVNGIENAVRSAIIKRESLDAVRDQMMSGEIDGALLPTSDALCIPNMEVIPGSAVSAVGASRVYFLVSKRMLPTEIQRVMIDMNDLGGQRFAAMMLAKKLMIRPSFVRSERPLDAKTYDLLSEDDGVDAYLLTGRNSLKIRKDSFPFTMDLTQTWFDTTRLPYVINCWIIRRGYQAEMLTKELADLAKRNSTDASLSARSAERLGINESGVRQIYTRALTTHFDPPVIQSIRMLAKLLTTEKIAPVPSVRIYAPPIQMRRV